MVAGGGGGHSISNPLEAAFVITLIAELWRKCPMIVDDPSSPAAKKVEVLSTVAVLTPYLSQKRLIQQALMHSPILSNQAHAVALVEVQTVDAFQVRSSISSLFFTFCKFLSALSHWVACALSVCLLPAGRVMRRM